MHLTQISHLRAALDLFWRQLRDGGEDRCHGHVDPNVDRTQLALGLIRRRLDRCGIGDVGGYRQGAHTIAPQIGGRALKPMGIAREQSNVIAFAGEFLSSGAPYASAGSGNKNNFAHAHS